MLKFAFPYVLGLSLLGVTPPAFSQQATPSIQSAVGHWLYDMNGELVGSVYALADSGQTAVLQFGSYLTPGRRLVSVPVGYVVIVNGRATLRTLTAADFAHLPPAG